MSLIPLFRALDDMYERGPSFQNLSPHFGNAFYPHHLQTARPVVPHLLPSGYRRNWQLADFGDKKSGSTITTGKDGFQVCLDVQQFAPNEITVKTVDNTVVIEGKHEEREDDHGFVSRHFLRRYTMPEEYNVKDIVSTLSSDGVLTVKAPPVVKAIENKEKIIHIQQTGPAHLSIKGTADKAAEETMTE